MGNHKLKSVPELHPSEEEFRHPIRYLSQPEISKLGEQYGILKVVPPENWKPKFALDWDTFKFHTRIQKLHELNLRNRSRACFVEGFNCFIQSIGHEPLQLIDDLCLGVSDDYPIKKSQLKSHLNGWLELKDGTKVHIHDIFISKEYRKWFYKINDIDRDFLKSLTTYSKRLLLLLGLNDDKNINIKDNKDENNLVISSENSHTTLHRLMISPSSLLAQPENLQQLQRMKTRISKFKRKENNNKKRKLVNSEIETIDLLTPPSDNTSTFSHNFEKKSNVETMNVLMTPELLTPESLNETCAVCHRSHNPESTLICDGCSRAFHMKCLPIPLDRVPKYDWFCGECLAGSTGIYSDYGFEEEFENKFSLNEFQNYCHEWEIEFLQLLKSGELGIDTTLKEEEIISGKLSEETIEKVFWYLTNGKMNIPDDLKIRYGADIHSEVPGELSGFPSIDNPRMNFEDAKYFSSEWNLTRLPFAKGSLLEYVCSSLINGEENDTKFEQISGMSIPWLYVGGTLSTFCWHKEDHYTLSANYSHLGAPKKWYGIPSKYAERFEELINNIAPEYETKQKDLMHQLVSMVSPDEIRKSILINDKNIEIYETIQRQGEFIVTFPKVYHSGFNYGFNVNEAVNFTLPLWVPYSVSAVKEYEKVGKECVFETFRLLKKIKEDLNTFEGKKLWMKDTGINENEILDILKWINEKYNEEVNKFLKLLNNRELKNILKRIPYISFEKYNKEEYNNIIGTDENNDFMDDKLCKDCKTRVHFQWVVVDLYEDCMQEIGYKEVKLNEVIIIDDNKNDYNMEGLGIKQPHQDEASEWREIIRKAKEEEYNDNKQEEKEKEEEIINDKEGGIRRSSRRIKNKRSLEIYLDNYENEIESVKDEERELINSLVALKKENKFFGKCVFCMGCFWKEINRLNLIEKERAISVSLVVEEYSLEELHEDIYKK
ncbi:hypothetical protein C6P40_003165 [Pichia californica]|uniref:[Histone H3]-trimethyl-L-lysine(4) demethylase n=1 Tax=Pichia californica TaxID=460514 RepID=A0A9P7BFB2_9ASCO|nr:hypothetical protein C6P40_003165 [[Candida] californica]